MSSARFRIGVVLPALTFAGAIMSAADAADDAPFESDRGITRLEQRAPAGKVPPAVPMATTPAVVDEQPSMAVADDDAADQAILTAFRTAYAKAGSPRVAVYFNRELSDEVREWIPGDQVQAEVQIQQTFNGQSLAGPVSGQVTTDAKADVRSRQYVGVTGGRDDPRESWKWEFEDAITRLFLDADANVVDRAVMFRQTARQSPQTAGMDGTVSTTLNEMSALEKYADVLVEMKVTRSGSALGYDFRATAKNIKTGRMLATAFVNNSKPRYVAGDRGYERREGLADLTIEHVSRALTLELMRSLTPHIGK